MDMNTTVQDGRECEFCGETATTVATVQTPRGEFKANMFRLCSDCLHDATTKCPTCGERILQSDGVRIYRSPELYCVSCSAAHPALIEGRYRAMLDDTLKGM